MKKSITLLLFVMVFFGCGDDLDNTNSKKRDIGEVISKSKNMEKIIGGFNDIDKTIVASFTALNNSEKTLCKQLIEETSEENYLARYNELTEYMGIEDENFNSIQSKISIASKNLISELAHEGYSANEIQIGIHEFFGTSTTSARLNTLGQCLAFSRAVFVVSIINCFELFQPGTQLDICVLSAEATWAFMNAACHIAVLSVAP